ncbi:MAG: ECF transporter S component [Firmicutes bacterium]|nr:ECF transporter S component [Dethiobacter sp.]MBS3889620.1 ECF transporter S component [Bacillota bacterium]MBS4055385.1 ECF transporter S component [Thermaerobacter sp.]
MNKQTRNLVIISMLAGMSYILMFVLQVPLIPSAPFLKYDPSDVPALIGAFIFGPLAGVVISFIKATLFLLTKGTSGPVGSIQNFLASASFALVAGLVYKKMPTKLGAFISMIAGGLAMTAVMHVSNATWALAAWGVPEAGRSAMLLTAILPFNLARMTVSTLITFPMFLGVMPILKRLGWIGIN